MDVTNPGLVSVADQVYGNPSTAADATAIPENNDVLVPAASQASPRASNDVGSSFGTIPLVSTPATQVGIPVSQVLGVPVVVGREINVDAQSIGKGGMVPNDAADPNGFHHFASPQEFLVVDEGQSIPIGLTVADVKQLVIYEVLDADTGLPPALANAYGTIASIADSIDDPGNKSKITVAGSLPPEIVDGQTVYIFGTDPLPGSAIYEGYWTVSNVSVPGGTFDITVTFVATATGNWYFDLQPATRRFLLKIADPLDVYGVFGAVTDEGGDVVKLQTNAAGIANLQDGDLIQITDSVSDEYLGAYSVFLVDNFLETFDIRVPFAGNTSGNWQKIRVADLDGYTVSMLGREIVFDEDTITEDDQGAVRNITGYGANFVVVNDRDASDLSVPNLTLPVAGDSFRLTVERQGSEVIHRDVGSPAEIDIFPSPPVNVPNVVPSQLSLGNVDVTTGTQPGQGPGQAVISSGENVPSSTTSNIADQAPAVGLPVNVIIV